MLAALTGAGFLIRRPTRRTYRRGGRDRTPAVGRHRHDHDQRHHV